MTANFLTRTLPTLFCCMMLVLQGCGYSGAATIPAESPAVPSRSAAPLRQSPDLVASRGDQPKCRTMDCFLTADRIEGSDLVTLEAAVASDASAFANLAAILKNVNDQDQWNMAVTMMGISGDHRAVESLRKFFLRDDSDAASKMTTGSVYRAKADVPYAMGLLLGRLRSKDKPEDLRSADELRAFMGKHLRPTPGGYGDLTWTAVDFPVELRSNMLSDLSLRFVQAVGVSQDAAALADLEVFSGELNHLRKQSKNGTIRFVVSSLSYPAEIVNPAFFQEYTRAITAARRH